jgi:hypothetical protein
MSVQQNMDTLMMTSLGGKKIMVVEYQPLVAADIEDRLLDAGAGAVTIVSKPRHEIDLSGFDGLVINASQDRELAQRVVGPDGRCAVVVLHDDAAQARESFPRAAIVEIPFDSEAIRDALIKALNSR